MPTLIALGVFLLLALGIACFAAYRIKARKFEFTTNICRLASLRITILTSTEEAASGKPQPESKP